MIHAEARINQEGINPESRFGHRGKLCFFQNCDGQYITGRNWTRHLKLVHSFSAQTLKMWKVIVGNQWTYANTPKSAELPNRNTLASFERGKNKASLFSSFLINLMTNSSKGHQSPESKISTQPPGMRYLRSEEKSLALPPKG